MPIKCQCNANAIEDQSRTKLEMRDRQRATNRNGGDCRAAGSTLNHVSVIILEDQ